MGRFKNTKYLNAIQKGIMAWSSENPRHLPWKDNRDPYQIWVSEIILQQTRVEQGLPYYLKFMERYPTLLDLANSTEDELMKIWEGLGYYRRARHMHQSAQIIVQQYDAIFPQNYSDILQLKGVGSYTAAAIASFAFDLPYVVVDGNVIRLISRLFALVDPVDDPSVRKEIENLASMLLDKTDPAFFNQAIMDFGAIQCKPVHPECNHCPLQEKCQAFQKDMVNLIPAKKEKKPRKTRFFYYLVPYKDEFFYIRKRSTTDIWSGLFEFYLIEFSEEVDWSKILPNVDLPIKRVHRQQNKYKQQLSHQIIQAEFLTVELIDDISILERDKYTRVKRKKIRNFAFPKVIDCFLKDKDVILNLH
ncbi:MAG: A/G-specific adenine glycosylase [Saprospiraceae bacterium]|nr:A/G-specific adenine glycosylase [Saprospiraceae bacterium]